MNILARFVHSGVQRFPRLKNFLKIVYQAPNVFLTTEPSVRNIRHCLIDAFLGFHDVSPWNTEGKKIAFHQTLERSRRIITPEDEVEIGYLDLHTGRKKIIDKTPAFNWQQGSRLQWVGSSDVLCYNIFVNGNLQSCFFDCVSGEKSHLPVPVYSIDGRGEYLVTTNFAVIEKYMSGYGYVGNYTEKSPSGSFSVWSVGSKQMVFSISLDELSSAGLQLTQDNYFISHFQFSPDGKTIAFFVRQEVDKDWYQTYFLTCDLLTRQLRYLAKVKEATHFAWMDNRNLLVFMKSAVVSAFHRLCIMTGEVSAIKALAELPDGHPFLDGGQLVIDSYPDARRNQNLYIFDPSSDALRKINSSHSPFGYSGYSRVDMHPKLRLADGLVAFDASNLRRHSVYICEI
jgi:hypothetical protein